MKIFFPQTREIDCPLHTRGAIYTQTTKTMEELLHLVEAAQALYNAHPECARIISTGAHWLWDHVSLRDVLTTLQLFGWVQQRMRNRNNQQPQQPQHTPDPERTAA